MEMSEGFYKALHYAKAAGSTVVFRSMKQFPRNGYDSPEASCSITRPGRIVWCDPVMDDTRGTVLIHDVHHDFIWRTQRIPPSYHHEAEAMFALDHLAMHRLGLPWLIWVNTFHIGDGIWWDNTKTNREKWLRESYADAVAHQWLTKKHQPTFCKESPW